MDTEADSFSQSLDCWPPFVPIGSFWKTSPAYCRRAAGGTWERSSGSWATAGIASRGECWMQGGAEFHSGAVACSLSDILTPDVPDRFYLSPRAARGILLRAEKRGRTLPARLRTALETLAMRGTQPISRTFHMPSADHAAVSAGNRNRKHSSPPASSPESERAVLPIPSTTTSWRVRRLTPVECEILMGFPPGWTVPDIALSETQRRSPFYAGLYGES